MLDAIVVGGGPAGLSAALVLGRCLRRVLVCDAGHPRNESARIFNGYRAMAHRQRSSYKSAAINFGVTTRLSFAK